MPQNVKFPPSVEIKRAIAAAERAGVQIGSVEIEPGKIVIFAKDATDDKPHKETYAEWKARHPRRR